MTNAKCDEMEWDEKGVENFSYHKPARWDYSEIAPLTAYDSQYTKGMSDAVLGRIEVVVPAPDAFLRECAVYGWDTRHFGAFPR